QVIARTGDPFRSAGLQRVDGFAEEPGDRQPDQLGQDEEEHEEDHFVAAALGVAPERGIELRYAAARKRVAHVQSTLFRSAVPSAISTGGCARVVGCHTREVGFTDACTRSRSSAEARPAE